MKGQLPESRGKTYILRLLSIYVDLYNNKYGIYPQVPIGRWGASLKRLMDIYTELQIAAMLIVFFNWKGMDGNDSFTEKKLINATHHFGWFFSTINTYHIYLQNVIKLDMDNEDEVRGFVRNYMLDIKK